mmetsp:Transcript_117344/g.215999  ORF Transcript_117344/g.215999 Transcript_117344/m.215999 type:complete len:480 (+) Transcript_117344:58-1497(+)
MAIHVPQPYVCPACDRPFTKWGLCRAHLASAGPCQAIVEDIHPDELQRACQNNGPRLDTRLVQPYVCPACGRAFTKWGLCRAHLAASETCQGVVEQISGDDWQQACRVDQPQKENVPDTIDMYVSTISGEFIGRITVSWCSTVSQTKEEIAELSQVPPPFQRLAAQNGEMNDSDKIAQFYHLGDSTIQVTLLVSFDHLTADLGSGYPPSQERALLALADLGTKGGQVVLSAVTEKMLHRSPQVRRAAITTLRKVSKKGDERAVASLVACCHDNNRSVALLALGTLAELSTFGDDAIKRVLTSCCMSKSAEVRFGAMSWLIEVAAKSDDEEVMNMLIDRWLNDRDRKVRELAVTGVYAISPHGVEHAERKAVLAIFHPFLDREEFLIVLDILEKDALGADPVVNWYVPEHRRDLFELAAAAALSQINHNKGRNNQVSRHSRVGGAVGLGEECKRLIERLRSKLRSAIIIPPEVRSTTTFR